MVVSKDEEIMVSICVMTFNLEKYISEALDSILMQKTNFNYHIIVGEDCSTDKTRQILHEYSNKYPDKFTLLLHEKNIGMLANFVETLKASTGRYIALLDGDDYWIDPLKLQKQVDFLESHKDYSMVFHNTELHEHTENGVDIKPFNREKQSREYTPNEILKTWCVTTCSVLCVNKDQYRYIANHLWFPVQDMPLYLCSASIGKIYYLAEQTSVYRRVQTGSVNSKDFNSINTRLLFVKYYKTLHKDFNSMISKKLIKNKCASNYLVAARKSKVLGHPKDYLKYLLYAIYYGPKFVFNEVVLKVWNSSKIKKQKIMITNRDNAIQKLKATVEKQKTMIANRDAGIKNLKITVEKQKTMIENRNKTIMSLKKKKTLVTKPTWYPPFIN